ncbi:MAG: hypothetical protein QXF26_03245, partial [Candidatus Bathyarchaeia archaeon]
AAKVHSGFVGRLALELVNLSNERAPITIRKGDPLMHIEFITREGAPSPYDGEFMFQFMTQEESMMYIEILSRSFPQVYDRAALVKMAEKRLSK